MLRTTIYSFITFIFISLLVGCSGTNGSISPVVPDETTPLAERVPQANVNPPVSDDFWHATITMGGKLWIANVNPNGTIHRAIGPGVKESSDPFEVIKNHPELFYFDPDNFKLEFDEVHAGLRYVILRQLYKGIWVWPSRVDLRYGRGGSLVQVGADVYPDININTEPSLGETTATNIVLNDVGPNEPFENNQLVVFASSGLYNLAYMVDAGNWRIWVDANSGEILKREHHLWEAYTGHVHTLASQADPLQPEIPYFCTDLGMRLRTSDSSTFPPYAYPITDLNGDYYYDDGGAHSQLHHDVRFYGPFINVNNSQGFPNNEAVIKRWVNDNEPQDWYFDNSHSIRSERTGWVWTHATVHFLKSIEPTYDGLDSGDGIYARTACNVNEDPMCNAMADETSMYFFQPADGCLDTGTVPDVIVHEFAHVNTFSQFGNDQPPLMMHEGMSDILANLMIENHFIGYNIAGEGTYFRDSKNTMKWPANECDGEDHCLGQLLAGAFWDMYEVLGKDYVGYLYHFSRYGHPQSFAEMAAEVVLVDDDDDDPLNGTPNYDLIYKCFKTNHNIAVPAAPNQPTSAISIDVVPASPQVHIGQSGGNFFFDLKITNHDATPTTFQIWAAIQAPAGWFYGPILPPAVTRKNPLTLTFQPEQTLQIHLRQSVPPFMPKGTWKYHIRVGQFVDHVHDVLMDDGWFDVYIDG